MTGTPQDILNNLAERIDARSRHTGMISTAFGSNVPV